MKPSSPTTISIIFLGLCAVLTYAQIRFKGRCPKLPVIKDFAFDRYLGRWFDQEKYFVAYQTVGRCWSGTYIKNKNSGKISGKKELDFRDVVLNRPNVITVDVFRKRPYEEPSRLTYTIPNVPLFEDNYEVLATDYKSWTIEYACVEKGLLGHTRIAWILTRSPHPPYEVIREAKAALVHLGIDLEYLEKSDTSCYKNYLG
ncbi:apolipoprotein D-like [Macrobrachium nipponense]|uniref:apolipoprotein D-like n=1 Tax=Macrobrachium nipponense TaxID=159736 RepID=UPI0030C8C6FE